MPPTPTQRPRRTSKPAVRTGEWSGDVAGFLAWCDTVEDPASFGAALSRVPPNTAWDSVVRSLRAGIQYRERPPDTAVRTHQPEVFLSADPDRGELRATKRAILETEITRRALAR